MLLAFLFALSILIVIHEYGHYQVAKWFNVKVLRFSIGLGKPLYTKTFGKDKTEFVISLVPLGGYVKMLDDSDSTKTHMPELSKSDIERSFNRQHVLKRIAIVSAGPIANLLLAVILYWIILLQGVVGFIPKLGEVQEGSIAALSGFKKSDVISYVDNQPILTWQDFEWAIVQKINAQKPIKIFVIESGNANRVLNLDLSSTDYSQLKENFPKFLGFSPYQEDIPSIVGGVASKSIAERAGLLVGDVIVDLNHIPVRNWDHLVKLIRSMPEKSIVLEVKRNERKVFLSMIVGKELINGVYVGKIGIQPDLESQEFKKMMVKKRFDILPALLLSLTKTWQTSLYSVKMFVNLIIGKAPFEAVSGPITIAKYAGDTANLGLKPYLAFLAVLSISLGVLNLLPIPILDGGHLMYYTAEIIRGRPLPVSWMEAGQKLGFIILALLMFLAIFNDLNKLVTGSINAF